MILSPTRPLARPTARRYFAASQVRVVFLEDLQRDPVVVLRSLESFLGLAPHAYNETLLGLQFHTRNCQGWGQGCRQAPPQTSGVAGGPSNSSSSSSNEVPADLKAGQEASGRRRVASLSEVTAGVAGDRTAVQDANASHASRAAVAAAPGGVADSLADARRELGPELYSQVLDFLQPGLEHLQRLGRLGVLEGVPAEYFGGTA
jgi:hypothetical protein